MCCFVSGERRSREGDVGVSESGLMFCKAKKRLYQLRFGWPMSYDLIEGLRYRRSMAQRKNGMGPFGEIVGWGRAIDAKFRTRHSEESHVDGRTPHLGGKLYSGVARSFVHVRCHRKFHNQLRSCLIGAMAALIRYHGTEPTQPTQHGSCN